MSEYPTEHVDKFISDNYESMTAQDMTDELTIDHPTVTYSIVSDRCKALNITPMSVKEKTRVFILNYYKTMTYKRMYKVLGFNSSSYFDSLLEEFGIKQSDFKQESDLQTA